MPLDESMEPTLYFMIDSMKVGTITAPMLYRSEDGKTGVRIIYFKGKYAPHKASLNDDFEKQVDGVKDLILAEVNVKEIEYVSGAGNIIQKKVKPDFKALGKKLGKNMKAVADVLASLSQEEIQQMEKSGVFETSVSGEIINLTREELEIVPVDIPGWLVATDAGLTVALDIQLSPELLAEGLARELVNRIQNIRKSSDFNVTDKISIQLEALEMVKPAITQFATYICSETLAEKLDLVAKGDGGEILELPEGEIWVKVSLYK
jgi:isoleucyl-tRNA synthetase